MKLSVKKRLWSWYIYDVYNEENRSILKVKHFFFNRNRFEITSSDGHVEYTVAKHLDKKGVQLAVIDKNGARKECEVSYPIDSKGKIVQTYLFQPPEPVYFKLSVDQGEFFIRRDAESIQRLAIWLNGKRCGSLEHMGDIFNHVICVDKQISPSFAVVLYVLGYFMVHDSDMEMV